MLHSNQTGITNCTFQMQSLPTGWFGRIACKRIYVSPQREAKRMCMPNCMPLLSHTEKHNKTIRREALCSPLKGNAGFDKGLSAAAVSRNLVFSNLCNSSPTRRGQEARTSRGLVLWAWTEPPQCRSSDVRPGFKTREEVHTPPEPVERGLHHHAIRLFSGRRG